MAGIFKRKRYVAAHSGTFKRQSAADTPQATAQLDTRVKATVTVEDVITTEPDFDCTDTDQVGETETSKLKRIRISYPKVSVQILSGWMAYFMSTAAAPTGSRVNEVQTITSTATGGTFTLSLAFEGKTISTSPIPFNATTAALQALLDAAFGSGNTTVSGAGAGTWIITFTGDLAATDLPLLTVNNAAATGGTATAAQTTAGSKQIHAITRSLNDALSYFSFVTAIENSGELADKFFKCVVDSLSFTLSRRRDVGLDVVILGRFTPEEIAGFAIPECIIPTPLRGKDCRVRLDGNWISDNFFTGTFGFNNAVPTGDDAFPFDDVEVQALERGDRPTYPITMTVLGSKGDAVYNAARNKEVVPMELHLGAPAERLSIFYPAAQLRMAGTDVVFVGDANRSGIPLEVVPYRDETLDAPLRAEAAIAQATAFLTT